MTLVRTNVLSVVVMHRRGLEAATARRVEGRATERKIEVMVTDKRMYSWG